MKFDKTMLIKRLSNVTLFVIGCFGFVYRNKGCQNLITKANKNIMQQVMSENLIHFILNEILEFHQNSYSSFKLFLKKILMILK